MNMITKLFYILSIMFILSKLFPEVDHVGDLCKSNTAAREGMLTRGVNMASSSTRLNFFRQDLPDGHDKNTDNSSCLSCSSCQTYGGYGSGC